MQRVLDERPYLHYLVLMWSSYKSKLPTSWIYISIVEPSWGLQICFCEWEEWLRRIKLSLVFLITPNTPRPHEIHRQTPTIQWKIVWPKNHHRSSVAFSQKNLRPNRPDKLAPTIIDAGDVQVCNHTHTKSTYNLPGIDHRIPRRRIGTVSRHKQCGPPSICLHFGWHRERAERSVSFAPGDNNRSHFDTIVDVQWKPISYTNNMQHTVSIRYDEDECCIMYACVCLFKCAALRTAILHVIKLVSLPVQPVPPPLLW